MAVSNSGFRSYARRRSQALRSSVAAFELSRRHPRGLTLFRGPPGLRL